MTARPIHPGELLSLADRLAARDAGRGRPRTIDLRRAVSSAYYAVFHELGARGTTELLQTGPVWDARSAGVSRWVGHEELGRLCLAAAGNGNDAVRAALGALHPDVAKIADAFLALKAARHSADYDDLYDVNKSIALGHASTAREAVDASGRLAQTNDPTYQLFLRLMLGATQAKNRS